MEKDPVLLKLSVPIALADGAVLSEITLREPTAFDMRAMPVAELTIGALLDLGASVAGLPNSAMNQLSAQDVLRVAGAMGNFMGGGTGRMPL